MKLSVITDEIDVDLGRALAFCEEFDIDTIELRSINGRSIVEYPLDELEEIHRDLECRGFRVCAIASPFLKCHRYDHAGRSAVGETHGATTRSCGEQELVLARAIATAQIMLAPIIRAFSYWREADPLAGKAELARDLEQAAEVATAAGVTLAIENEPEPLPPVR